MTLHIDLFVEGLLNLETVGDGRQVLIARHLPVFSFRCDVGLLLLALAALDEVLFDGERLDLGVLAAHGCYYLTYQYRGK